MIFTALSVRNPVAAKLFTILIIGAGIVALSSMRREAVPTAPIDEASVTISYYGATPDEMDRLVARPVERAVVDIRGVRNVESRLFEGISYTKLLLENGIDQSQVMDHLRSAVERVRPDLPSNIEEPEVTLHQRFNPVMEVVIYGDVTEARLRREAIQFRDDLARSPMISKINLDGIRRRELWVEADPDRLEQFRLDYSDVADAIAAANRDFPGGQLRGPRGRMRIRTVGESLRTDDIEELIVKGRTDGSVVRVGDVCAVSDVYEERIEIGRWNGHRAVRVQVMKDANQDVVEIADIIRKRIAGDDERLAGAIRIDILRDFSKVMHDRLAIVWESAQSGLVLVLLVLALFLNMRLAFWVALGIPVSFFGTFVLMRMFGLSLNLYTLGALVVAIGLIVDDAVVVGENIFSRLKSGRSPAEAAYEGVRGVSRPVLTATLTTVAAWLPLTFISGRLGSLLAVIPYVVISGLAVSILECFVMMPGHLAHPSRISWGKLGRIAAAIGRVRNMVVERVLINPFARVVDVMIRWRYVTICGVLACVMALVGLVVSGSIPFVLVQDDDKGAVHVKVEMAAGTPGEVTDATLEQIAERVRECPEVVGTFNIVGSVNLDRGGTAASDPVTVGRLYAYLVSTATRQAEALRDLDELIAALRKTCQNVPGASRLTVSRPASNIGRDLELILTGRDTEILAEATDYVSHQVAGFAGVTDVEDDFRRGKRETRLVLRDRARTLGLTAKDVAQQVRGAAHGIKAQEIHSGVEEVRVMVRLASQSQQALSDVSRLTVVTPAGARLPLSEVADVRTERGVGALYRWDLEPSASVRANVDETEGNVAAITSALRERFAGIDQRFPGVSVSFEGRERVGDESIRFLARVGFPVAMLLIYAIIAMAFGSYVQPLLVMSVIPVAVFGAVFGHYLMGSPVTFVSLLVCIALTGIVVNDSLVLLDRVRHLRAEGLSPTGAATQAAANRLRAILITSITTMAGVTPLMLATNENVMVLVPGAITLFFGLAFGTIVVLVLLPTGYLVIEDVARGLRWLRTGSSSPSNCSTGV